MKMPSALLTLMLHVVDHDSFRGSSPASIWISVDKKKVLDGGPYPDEVSDSVCISKNMTFADAELLQNQLAEVLAKLNVSVDTELMSDD